MGVDKKLAILAASKLGAELCVAGVDNQYNWIRPTCFIGSWRQFFISDIYDREKKAVIELSNVVTIRLVRPVPQAGTPHIEDWQYDQNIKPRFLRTLEDRRRLRIFKNISEKTLAPLIVKYERSLCLIEPSSIDSVDFANLSVRGKYQPMMVFTFQGEKYRYKVTDIYWRALGRYLLGQKHPPVISGKKLRNILGYTHLFLTVGLSRKFQDKYWPFIVGVHPVPRVPIQLNYKCL